MSAKLQFFEMADVIWVVVGIGVLALAALLNRLKDRIISFPAVALLIGYVAWTLPLPLPTIDIKENETFILHLTELGVIVSLMGVGLKIDRTPNFRTWMTTWRLLLICMPLSILGIAVLGSSLLGLTPAAAFLLGAVLAPTDPVLASDLQVGEPNEPESDNERGEENEDEVRFTLTSEAGLNDSLAFPFTYFAIHLATLSSPVTDWVGQWFLIDVIYRLTIGTIAGVVLGYLLSRVLLAIPHDSERDQMTAGIGAIAATLLLYSVTECFGGYGFLATFIGALVIRYVEKSHQSHRSFHAMAEQLEQLFMTLFFIGLGGAIACGQMIGLSWKMGLLALLAIIIVRPFTGWISLLGSKRIHGIDRGIASFYGIRGVGTVFYLSYALSKHSFESEQLLWTSCILIIVASTVVHGFTASAALRFRNNSRLKAD